MNLAIIFAALWIRAGVIQELPDGGAWVAKGWTPITAEAAAATNCVKAGGTWTNGVCVMPPPPEPLPYQSFDLPIVAPSFVVNPVDGHGYEIAVDPSGEVFAVERMSTWKTDAEIQAARQARVETNKALRVALREIKGAMSTNINEVQAISVTGTSSTAQVRSAVIDLRRELIDTQRELQNLRAVVRDMQRGKD